jgi:hypothetical protein
MYEQEIFLAALDCESAQDLKACLDEACGVDSALRLRIEALLSRHAEASQFLEHPPIELAATQLESEVDTPSDSTGTKTTSELDSRTLDFLEPSDNPECLGNLGQYEILEVVGRGGMGLVFKARDKKLDRIVAVKVLAPEIASIPAAHKRFLREAQTAGSISHDHIVTIYAVESGACPYLG